MLTPAQIALTSEDIFDAYDSTNDTKIIGHFLKIKNKLLSGANVPVLTCVLQHHVDSTVLVSKLRNFYLRTLLAWGVGGSFGRQNDARRNSKSALQ